MAINSFKIIKWLKMLTGNSVYHVNQNEGLVYSKNELRGYYNNLTEKVTKYGLKDNSVPTTILDSGEEVFFPIAIFQYGLAAFDLYLIDGSGEMLEKAMSCANWAIDNQEISGGWKAFEKEFPGHPYSSMAQGEAISLLSRIYKETNQKIYIDSAKKAIDMMLLPIEKGGTTKYIDNRVYLFEYTHKPIVLNGWIFSLWGLLDYYKVTKDEKIERVYKQTLVTLNETLSQFDIGYWSKYDCEKTIASPFYHKLHVAQLRTLYKLTDNINFKIYADKFEEYSNNKLNRLLAFLKKAIQKIRE